MSSTAKEVVNKASTVLSKGMNKADLITLDKIDYYADRNFEAILLWVLKNTFFFSPQQLKEFYQGVVAADRQHPEAKNSLRFIPEVGELKNMGVDVEMLFKEALQWQ